MRNARHCQGGACRSEINQRASFHLLKTMFEHGDLETSLGLFLYLSFRDIEFLRAYFKDN